MAPPRGACVTLPVVLALVFLDLAEAQTCDVSGVTQPTNGQFGTNCAGTAGTIGNNQFCDLTCDTGYYITDQPQCSGGTLSSTTATCTACTSQTGCGTDGTACSSDQDQKLVCTAVANNQYYLSGTNNEIATACTAVANSASGATVTCTSATTSRVTACATGFVKVGGEFKDTCEDSTEHEHSGTMTAALTLSTGASNVDDYYNNWHIKTTTPADSGIVTDYIGSTRVISVSLEGGGTTTSSTVYVLTQYTQGDHPVQTGQMTAEKTLAADSSYTDDFYNGWTIVTETPADTGLVTDYDAGTKLITVNLAGGSTTSASTTYTISAYPTVVITAQDQGSASINSGDFNDASTITFTFTLSVAPAAALMSAFEFTDLVMTNCDGSSSDFSGSGTSYTLPCAASDGNAITATVKADSFVDADANANVVSSTFTVNSDTTKPTVTITASDQDGASIASGSANDASAITFTFTLSETPVSSLFTYTGGSGDITMANCAGTNSQAISGSGTVYTLVCDASDGNDITADVPADGFTDAAGNTNSAATQYVITSDTTAPTVTITASDGTSAISDNDYNDASSITFTFALSEAAAAGTAFEYSDITTSNCDGTSISGSGTSFLLVCGAADGSAITAAFGTPYLYADQLVTLGTSGFTDAAGNDNTAAAVFTINSDTTKPYVTITATDNAAAGITSGSYNDATTITFTFTLSETPVTDLFVHDGTTQDVTATNCGSSGNPAIAGSGTAYTLECPASDGNPVTVTVAVNKFTDDAGNANAAAGSTACTSTSCDLRTYASFIVNSDTTAPTVTITATDQDDATVTSGAPNDASVVTFTFTLSEAPASEGDFAENDITSGHNCNYATETHGTQTASTWAGSGTAFTLTCAATDGNTITMAVAGSKFTDAAGNNNAATTADFTVLSDTTAPFVTITATDHVPAAITAGSENAATTMTFTFQLSEASTDFADADVTKTNCDTPGTISGTGQTYTGTCASTTDNGRIVSMTVGAGKFTDAAGNSNAAPGSAVCAATSCSLATYAAFTIDSDTVATTTTVAVTDSGGSTISSGGYSNSPKIKYTFTLDELAVPTSSFTYADLTVANCDNNLFEHQGSTKYTLECDAKDGSEISVAVQQGSSSVGWTDGAGNYNDPVSAVTVNSDISAPTVTITATDAGANALANGAVTSDATSPSAITFSFTVSEAVSNFVQGDVTATGCNGPVWDATAAPAPAPFVYVLKCEAADGTDISVSLAENVLSDAAGNGNAAVSKYSVTSDTSAPTVTITASDDGFATTLNTNAFSRKSVITWKFTLSEPPQPKADLIVGDLTQTNCINPIFSGTDTIWYLRCDANSAADGSATDITVGMQAAKFTDKAGTDNTAGTDLVIKSDIVRPTVTITATDAGANALANGAATSDATSPSAITFSFTVSELTADFVQGDVTATGCNGPVWDATAAPAPAPFVYVLKCEAADGTDISVSLAENVLSDAAGNGNAAVSKYSVTSDTSAPTVTITASDDGFATTLNTNAFSRKSVITWKFTLSEPPQPKADLIVGDLTQTNCINPIFSGTDTIWYLRCDANSAADGSATDITVGMQAAKFTDKAGTDNTAGTDLVIKSDIVRPTVTITATDAGANALANGAATSDATSPSAITFSFTVSELTADFVQGDVTATGCNGPVWDATAAPAPAPFVYVLKCEAADGTDISVSLAENVLSDAAGNGNAAVSKYSVTSDTSAPTVTITAAEATTAAASLSSGDSTSQDVTFTITLSKPSQNFVLADITKSNCGADNSPKRFTGFKTTYYLTCAHADGLTASVNVAGATFTSYGGVDNTAASGAFTVVFT